MFPSHVLEWIKLDISIFKGGLYTFTPPTIVSFLHGNSYHPVRILKTLLQHSFSKFLPCFQGKGVVQFVRTAIACE